MSIGRKFRIQTRVYVTNKFSFNALAYLARIFGFFLFGQRVVCGPEIVFSHDRTIFSCAKHRLATLNAAIVFFLDHYFVFQAKLGLTLDIHAHDFTRIACTMLAVFCIPDFIVQIEMAEILARFARFRLAFGTTFVRL